MDLCQKSPWFEGLPFSFMSWTPFKCRSMNWSEMLVELRRRRQLVFHPIAFSTSIQSLWNVKNSKKKTVSQLTSVRGRFGTSGHPRFLLQEMAIANNRYVTMLSDDTMLTLIFWKNLSHPTNSTPKAGAILRTPLEHTVWFKVLSSSNYNVKSMPIVTVVCPKLWKRSTISF